MSRKNSRVSEATRRALINKDEEGGDYIQLARDFGVKRTTAIANVKSGNPYVCKRGGRRDATIKLTDDDMNLIIEKIENNPSITLKEIRTLVNNKVCIATV